jgi:hypothetical protein
LLDALQVDAQPRLLPECYIDRLGKRKSLARFTDDLTRLSRFRQSDDLAPGIVDWFRLPRPVSTRTSRSLRRLLGRLWGRFPTGLMTIRPVGNRAHSRVLFAKVDG